MPLKPIDALKIMQEHGCEMTLPSLYAWLRSKNSPCPFGVYTQSNEENERGTYTIFENRLMFWLGCHDMRVAYGGNYAAPPGYAKEQRGA